jgi:hypothetical protein
MSAGIEVTVNEGVGRKSGAFGRSRVIVRSSLLLLDLDPTVRIRRMQDGVGNQRVSVSVAEIR